MLVRVELQLWRETQLRRRRTKQRREQFPGEKLGVAEQAESDAGLVQDLQAPRGMRHGPNGIGAAFKFHGQLPDLLRIEVDMFEGPVVGQRFQRQVPDFLDVNLGMVITAAVCGFVDAAHDRRQPLHANGTRAPTIQAHRLQAPHGRPARPPSVPESACCVRC